MSQNIGCRINAASKAHPILTMPLFFCFFVTDISTVEAKTAIYCETTQILQTVKHKMVTSKNEHFRMTASNEVVVFGINGFTGGTNTFKISSFTKITDWQSDFDRFYLSFLNGDFYFSATFPESSTAVSARCKIY